MDSRAKSDRRHRKRNANHTAQSMTVQVCQAWRRELRIRGLRGASGGATKDATVAIPSLAAGRLRLPHPATARNLPSAADLRLAELCSHLRRGLSSIQTRGDAACRKCSRQRRREGARWAEWLRGHERVWRAIASLRARNGRGGPSSQKVTRVAARMRSRGGAGS